MRKMKLFKLENLAAEPHYKVAAIHDERGYKSVRRALASQYDPSLRDPNIQVTSADLAGDRRLVLTHQMHNDVPLAERDAKAVLGHIADLWGFDVQLRGVGAQADERYSFEMALADQGLQIA
jgi:spore cortex formation protein SpoVR/YcgB (stage V sporulation)